MSVSRRCDNPPVSEENQFIVPPSFIELFIEPGRVKPRASREVIAQRYEFCEDMAQMLSETARDKLWQLQVTEADVLERVHRGLLAGGTGVDDAEARWVIRRVAELLGWDDPCAGDAGAS